MSTLSLDNVVDVSITVGPVSSVRTSFNAGLIIGDSTIIDTTTRVKSYAKLADMLSDGWTGSEAEYLAATKYFSQAKRPSKVYIGRWDSAGTETPIEAVTACRTANTDWYVCTVCGATKAEIIAIAAYIEAADPVSTYFYTTSDSDVLNNVAGNVFETLKTTGYTRTLGQYSTTANAVCAIMGWAMGANDGTSGSAFTLDCKKEVGVTAESITSSQYTAMTNLYGNIYVNMGSVYNVFQKGTMASGSYFDEILGLDMLKNNIQTAIMDGLQSSNKISQTDDGVTSLVNYITTPLEKARTTGFIAAGIWNTTGILTVSTGDTLSRGYKIIAESVADQSQTDREARKAPPIYVLVKLAGSIQYVAISVYVNR